MRRFIVSDLHGNGNMYKSIMGYLDNLSKDYGVTLYINGDLIDRGDYSAYMLLDVIRRKLDKNGFKIKYLAGNHELMMYQTALKRSYKNWPKYCEWFLNGGEKTIYPLEEVVTEKQEEKIIEFISKLNVYHKFKEKLNDKNIVLVHAKCPRIVEDVCKVKIRDNDFRVHAAVWTRQRDLLPILKDSLGNKDYFTIIGHTPVIDEKGYEYYQVHNCLNIDGGCAGYALGYKEYNHTPLVEIDGKNNKLDILTFNNNNEIIMGNYFSEGTSIEMDSYDLCKKKKYINKNVKIKH